MAKKSTQTTREYSTGDLCLIALLSQPVKAYKIKKSDTSKIKKSEELLRSIVYHELILNHSMPSSSTTP